MSADRRTSAIPPESRLVRQQRPGPPRWLMVLLLALAGGFTLALMVLLWEVSSSFPTR